MKRKNIIGNRYGRLVVIEERDTIKRPPRSYVRRFLCQCDCGNKTIASYNNLSSGSVRSCGCLKKDCGKGVLEKELDDPKLRLCRTWRDMKHRCNAKSGRYYNNYVKRGITVCPEWRTNFKAFYDWAINNGYMPTLSIDRIDNSKGYSPDNCRWANPKMQNNNLRTNVTLTYNGITRTLREWSDITGIRFTTLHSRVNMGWDAEKILTQSVRKHNKSK